MKVSDMMHGAGEALGGKEKAPKKEIDHIRTKKAKSGGYVHEHHFTYLGHHAPETHVSANQKQMAAHMIESLGAPTEDAGADAAPQPDASAGAPPAAGAPMAPPTPGM